MEHRVNICKSKFSDVGSVSPAHESVQYVFRDFVSIVVLFKAFWRPCVNLWVFLFFSWYHSDKNLQSHAPSLLQYFNRFFQQKTSWTEFKLPQKLTSYVISSLRGKRLTLELWRRLPKPAKNTGANGDSKQEKLMSTHSSKIPTPSSETICC